jgi:hypothetical protein
VQTVPLFGRKHHRDRSEQAPPEELPNDLEVPEGMTAVPAQQADEWAGKIVDGASDNSISGRTPPFVDAIAKVAILDVCGRERGMTIPGPGGLLAYNLELLGYWCRFGEIATLGYPEVHPDMTGLLTTAHDSMGLGWFEIVQWAAHTLADNADARAQMAAWLPTSMGDDFRRRLALVAISRIASSIDVQHPGASSLLNPEELLQCWSLGYWMRATSVSLPNEAHIEFDEQNLGEG